MVTLPGGTRHDQFGDGGVLLPGADQARSKAVMATIRTYTAAFFEETLNGKPSPLLAGHSTSDKVTVQAYRAGR